MDTNFSCALENYLWLNGILDDYNRWMISDVKNFPFWIEIRKEMRAAEKKIVKKKDSLLEA